ncbi:hypothetical protein EG835_14955 [bacterium]|nr:hypothetical protein [bacterium]
MLLEGIALIVTVVLTVIVAVVMLGVAVYILGFMFSAPLALLISGKRRHDESPGHAGRPAFHM